MDLWVVTCKSSDNDSPDSIICKSRLDAMLEVAGLRNFRPDKIRDTDHISGSSEQDGLVNQWSIDHVLAV